MGPEFVSGRVCQGPGLLGALYLVSSAVTGSTVLTVGNIVSM